MRIKLLRGLKLIVDGKVFHHKAGDVLSLPDKFSLGLISNGKARQVFSPPVPYSSRMLGEIIWLINDPSQSEDLAKREVNGTFYTAYEYYLLERMNKRNRKLISEVKKVFPDSTILDTAPAWIKTIDFETEGGDSMKKHEAFPSKFLTKEDLDQPKVWTISEIVMEEVRFEDDKEDKPICYFEEQVSKPLVLNSTNWTNIEELYGEDSDAWTGQQIEIYRENNVMFGKKKVGGVRVRKPSTLFDRTQFKKVLSTENSEEALT